MGADQGERDEHLWDPRSFVSRNKAGRKGTWKEFATQARRIAIRRLPVMAKPTAEQAQMSFEEFDRSMQEARTQMKIINRSGNLARSYAHSSQLDARLLPQVHWPLQRARAWARRERVLGALRLQVLRSDEDGGPAGFSWRSYAVDYCSVYSSSFPRRAATAGLDTCRRTKCINSVHCFVRSSRWPCCVNVGLCVALIRARRVLRCSSVGAVVSIPVASRTLIRSA